MEKLLNEDLQYVVSALPKSVREILKSRKVFLAGGFIRAMIAGEKPSDIDLLCSTTEMCFNLSDELEEEREGFYQIKTKNALTIVRNHHIPVQIITRWLYDDPEKLLNEFDFTIAQAVIWYQKEEGWLSLTSNNFYCDLASKRLRYTSPKREEDAGGSLLRVLKFLRRGYKIAPESLSLVIVQMLNGVKNDRSLDNPELSKIVTSLMREVDPLTVDLTNNIIINEEEEIEENGNKTND